MALVSRALFQARLEAENGEPFVPRGVDRVTAKLHQRLFERGTAPPWVFSAERCQEYWESQGQKSGDLNAPSSYAAKSRDIVRFMHEFWSPEIAPRDSVLELGCNSGANLEGLRAVGFSDLAGVEINPAAVQEMRVVFPELAGIADVRLGSLESVLPVIPSFSRDVVFSMAVLIHVHPSSNAVLEQMVRIARRYVCVIEAEWVTCSYIFARNYRRMFERLGAEHVRSHEISRRSLAGGQIDEYVGYTARLFRVPARP